MPHFGHVIALRIVEVKAEVLIGVLIGVRTTSSRSDNGRRACVVAGVGSGLHSARDIDPDEPVNMSILLAFDEIQAVPQSVCLNDSASSNMPVMSLTLDTSQLERSPLNADAS